MLSYREVYLLVNGLQKKASLSELNNGISLLLYGKRLDKKHKDIGGKGAKPSDFIYGKSKNVNANIRRTYINHALRSLGLFSDAPDYNAVLRALLDAGATNEINNGVGIYGKLKGGLFYKLPAKGTVSPKGMQIYHKLKHFIGNNTSNRYNNIS